MKRIAVGIVLGLTTAMAVVPEFRISASQPWSGAMQSAYGVLPELGAGTVFERTKNVAVALELGGGYARSRATYGETNLWFASLRSGLLLTTGAPVGLYVTPGLMITGAGEQFPSYDSLSGIISRRWYSGAALGGFLNAGVLLFNVGGWHCGLETGIDLVSVPTERRNPVVGWGGYYSDYSISLSALKLGLTLSKTEKPPEQ